MRALLGLLMAIVGFGWMAGSAGARDWYGPPSKTKTIQYKAKGDSILRDGALDLGDLNGDAGIADGRIYDTFGDGVFHTTLATIVVGDPGSGGCDDDQEPIVGVDLFEQFNGGGAVMYRRGSSLRTLLFDLEGCQDPDTLAGTTRYSLLVVGGSGRFEKAEGLIRCSQSNTGLVGAIAGVFECEGEITLPYRHRYGHGPWPR